MVITQWNGMMGLNWSRRALCSDSLCKTLGAVHPLAIEYRADDATSMADISDGEGYISAGGAVWERAEENYQCNLCLKAYTTIRR